MSENKNKRNNVTNHQRRTVEHVQSSHLNREMIEMKSRLRQVIDILQERNADKRMINILADRYENYVFEYEDILKAFNCEDVDKEVIKAIRVPYYDGVVEPSFTDPKEITNMKNPYQKQEPDDPNYYSPGSDTVVQIVRV